MRSRAEGPAQAGRSGRYSRSTLGAARGSDRRPGATTRGRRARRQLLPQEGVPEHLMRVPQDEAGVVPQHHGKVPQLHPPLGAPPEELNLVRGQVLAAHDGGGAVVLFEVLVDDEIAGAKFARHRCAWIRRRVLDVLARSTHSRAKSRLASIDCRVSLGLATISPPVIYTCRAGAHTSTAVREALPTRRRARGWRSLAPARRNCRSSSTRFSMPRNTLTKAGRAHQRRQRLAVRRDQGGHRLHVSTRACSPASMMARLQTLEARDVQRDVVAVEEQHPRAVRRVANIVEDAIHIERAEVAPRISMIEQKLQSKVQPREAPARRSAGPAWCSRRARGRAWATRGAHRLRGHMTIWVPTHLSGPSRARCTTAPAPAREAARLRAPATVRETCALPSPAHDEVHVEGRVLVGVGRELGS